MNIVTDHKVAWTAGESPRRAHSDAELESLQAQLMQTHKLEQIGRLAVAVAHDFNNMLMVILGHTEIAAGKLEKDHRAQLHLQEIRKTAHRSASLTQQLLTYARKPSVNPKVLSLNDTLVGMFQMLRSLVGDNITLNWLPGERLWPIKAGPSQIDQLMANLCVNARDAISGSGTITIETCNVTFDECCCLANPEGRAGDYVALLVSDNGCGMDQETQASIFEPFFTTKDPGKGTGLGLATVYGVVKQNNGFIDVSSEPGCGTTFKIYFPRYVGQLRQTNSATSTRSKTGELSA